ncbi:hypothetical protein GCM10027053_26070 [Intrasporangium mesophilum]
MTDIGGRDANPITKEDPRVSSAERWETEHHRQLYVGGHGAGGAERRRPVCPPDTGRRRLTATICAKFVAKLVLEMRLRRSNGPGVSGCKSVAKATKVRILHLPPCAQKGL